MSFNFYESAFYQNLKSKYPNGFDSSPSNLLNKNLSKSQPDLFRPPSSASSDCSSKTSGSYITVPDEFADVFNAREDTSAPMRYASPTKRRVASGNRFTPSVSNNLPTQTMAEAASTATNFKFISNNIRYQKSSFTRRHRSAGSPASLLKNAPLLNLSDQNSQDSSSNESLLLSPNTSFVHTRQKRPVNFHPRPQSSRKTNQSRSLSELRISQELSPVMERSDSPSSTLQSGKRPIEQYSSFSPHGSDRSSQSASTHTADSWSLSSSFYESESAVDVNNLIEKLRAIPVPPPPDPNYSVDFSDRMAQALSESATPLKSPSEFAIPDVFHSQSSLDSKGSHKSTRKLKSKSMKKSASLSDLRDTSSPVTNEQSKTSSTLFRKKKKKRETNKETTNKK